MVLLSKDLGSNPGLHLKYESLASFEASRCLSLSASHISVFVLSNKKKRRKKNWGVGGGVGGGVVTARSSGLTVQTQRPSDNPGGNKDK